MPRDEKEFPVHDEKNGYIPFGDGFRKCPGFQLAYAEMICGVASVISRAKLAFPPGQSLPHEIGDGPSLIPAPYSLLCSPRD